nr:N-acetylmuramic acid 6-phosphate etherase [uncultured Gellertiella sp.]
MILETTELRHDDGVAFDTLAPADMLSLLWRGQLDAIEAVEAALPALALAAERVASTLSGGGRLIYAGAGSSGLMAMADALELPGTYGIDPRKILILMAGGLPGSSGAPPELPGGPEDDAGQGEAEVLLARVGAGDCVLAVSASGSTPYVLGVARAARAAGAGIIGFANNAGAPLFAEANVAVLLPTPPEVVAGSTRMGAGTAQKIAFNIVSTLAGVMLGHVHDGHMVNLVADNAKLRARATRMVSEISGIGRKEAEDVLVRASGSVKIAVLLASGAASKAEASALLSASRQHLRSALQSLQAINRKV